MSPASGSVVDSVPTAVATAWFSDTLALDSATSVGASFTLLTVIVSTFSTVSAPASVARTRIE